MTQLDPRRSIPRTDQLLALAGCHRCPNPLGRNGVIRTVVRDAQEQRASRASLRPDQVDGRGARGGQHTQRDQSAAGAQRHRRRRAHQPRAGTAGVRGPRGAGVGEWLRRRRTRPGHRHAGQTRCRGPSRPARRVSRRRGRALVVNNGAAALVLATTALAAGREVVVSRGELIEIGAGFRLPDLIASTGARLREVGTTNRTTLGDYADGHRPRHRLRAQGPPEQLPRRGLHRRGHRSPSWLPPRPARRRRHRQRPARARPAAARRARRRALAGHGADVVTASGDKLLGGPQAGLVLGRADARGPAARAPAGPGGPGRQADPGRAGGDARAAARPGRRRACTPTRDALRRPAHSGSPRPPSAASVVAHDGRVGRRRRTRGPAARLGGRAPRSGRRGLRTGDPAVLPRVHDGACLLDLRCMPEADDGVLTRPIALSRPSRQRQLTMHVVATAGHVDHGKSTLVRALTGMEPDRWAEERRRGLTIDLGFAWTTLPSGRDVGLRRRAGPRALPRQHARRARAGAGGLLRRRRRRGLAGAVERSPRRRRRAGHRARLRASARPTAPRRGSDGCSPGLARSWPEPVCTTPRRSRCRRHTGRRPGRIARPLSTACWPGAPARDRAGPVLGGPLVHHHRRRHRRDRNPGRRNASRRGPAAAARPRLDSRRRGPRAAEPRRVPTRLGAGRTGSH